MWSKTQKTEKQDHRRRYLVARRFQLRFALQTLLLLVLTSLVIGWSLYYGIWNASEEQLQLLMSQNLIDHEDALEFQKSIHSSLWERVLLRLLLLIFIAFVFTVFTTHRIAGPVSHMEGAVQDYLNGNPPRTIKLRKTDEFQNMAELLNDLMRESKK